MSSFDILPNLFAPYTKSICSFDVVNWYSYVLAQIFIINFRWDKALKELFSPLDQTLNCLMTLLLSALLLIKINVRFGTLLVAEMAQRVGPFEHHYQLLSLSIYLFEESRVEIVYFQSIKKDISSQRD